MNKVPAFVVSGGARGVTAQCVVKLSQAIASRWILIGRSEMMPAEPNWAKGQSTEAELKRKVLEDSLARGEKPKPVEVSRICRSLLASREIEETLQAIREAGNEAIYLSVDITRLEDVSDRLLAIVSKWGAVAGLIHGAGALADKPIANKTEADFARVYDTKVTGLQNLLQCLPAKELKYLVLFSSVAGFYGNAGQADYAIANEILNKTALKLKQQYPSCHTVAINWGPWEMGMVTPALKEAFESRGVRVLPVEAATQLLVNELSCRYQSTAQVVIGAPIPTPPTPLSVLSAYDLRTHHLRRRLTVSDNPFLQDHKVSGLPVLPFTCMMAWIGRAGERIYPGFRAAVCENVRLLKGIIFNESAAEDYRLTLKELSKSDDEIVMEGQISSTTVTGKVRYHFMNTITLRRRCAPRPRLSRSNLMVDGVIASSADFYGSSAAFLFHGPSFQGLQRVLNISDRHITAQCKAHKNTAQQQGQFPISTIDPYTTDIQLHPVLVWLQHYHQTNCLPAAVERYEIFESPPYEEPFYISVDVIDRTATRLSVNITAHSEAGEVYTQIVKAASTVLPRAMQIA